MIDATTCVPTASPIPFPSFRAGSRIKLPSPSDRAYFRLRKDENAAKREGDEERRRRRRNAGRSRRRRNVGKKDEEEGAKNTPTVASGGGKRVGKADKARANGTRAKNDEERAKVSAREKEDGRPVGERGLKRSEGAEGAREVEEGCRPRFSGFPT